MLAMFAKIDPAAKELTLICVEESRAGFGKGRLLEKIGLKKFDAVGDTGFLGVLGSLPDAHRIEIDADALLDLEIARGGNDDAPVAGTEIVVNIVRPSLGDRL